MTRCERATVAIPERFCDGGGLLMGGRSGPEGPSPTPPMTRLDTGEGGPFAP